MREAAKGVELLLSASLLHRRCAHLDDDEPDAGILEASVSSTLCRINLIVVMIQTCIAAAATMFSTDNKSKNRRKSHTISQPDSDSPKPIDMLVDVLIGFLEKSTSYLRAMANKSFSCIASAATETTIDLIVAVSDNFLLIGCTSFDFVMYSNWSAATQPIWSLMKKTRRRAQQVKKKMLMMLKVPTKTTSLISMTMKLLSNCG